MLPKPSESLLQRFQAHDRQALSRILTLAEAGHAPPLPKRDTPNCTRKVPIVAGITGSGGAGKSTLIKAIIGHLRELGKTVAVLANDPQSPVTGGALLGDRIRVPYDPADEGIYFRSFSTRGAQGGISAASGPAVDWLREFGFHVILIETVGVGQDQVAVRQLVDRLALLVTPGTGDEIQWEKAGLIELADVVVVNKCDLPGADQVKAEMTSALSLSHQRTPPPVLGTIATTGEGIRELWQTIAG